MPITLPDLDQAVYEATAAIAGQGEVAPPWFAPALKAALEAALAPIAQTLASTTRLACIAYNLQSGDGHARTFKVVPFIDGTLPTDPPNNLPALLDANAVAALTGQQATAYLTGYNTQVPHAIQDRKAAIQKAIGCTTLI